ncbi:hypothetical protein BX600DRAFT_488253 [Xylariales sp. PMI_506]|nr:hypothetical protein BX600DRAFT_488253 [Xylariales sp. PMI_506]
MSMVQPRCSIIPRVFTKMVKRTPPDSAPDFDGFTPNFILEEVNTILSRSKALQDELVTSVSPSTASFAIVIRPMIDDANRAACRLQTLGNLLATTAADASLREASREAQRLILKGETERFLRRDIAALVAAAYAHSQTASADVSGADNTLDAQDLYLLAQMHGEYARSGAAIQDEAQQAWLQNALAELNELRLAAQKTLNDADDGIWFTRSELPGISEEALASLTLDKDDQGDSAKDRYWVPFRSKALVAIMRDAEDARTRRKYFLASERRFPDNVGRLQRIIVLRHEIAQVLGFANHAALKMAERMSQSVGEVKSLLEEIRQKIDTFSKADIEELLQLKRDDIGHRQNDPARTESSEDSSQLYAWDWAFYANKLKKENYSIDAKQIREYFEARHTLLQMLQIFQNLFGIEFEEAEISTWHQDCTAYTVWDSPREGGGFLGYLYIDIFGRSGKKQNAFHLVIRPGFTEADGTRHFPADALICSFPPPTQDRPSLLLLNQVRTMFHELGHAIHYLVSKTKYALPHPRDYVEIPSIMLEHWLYNPKVLVALGKKHSTSLKAIPAGGVSTESTTNTENETLPPDLIETIIRTENLHKAREMLILVQRGLYDLAIHTPSDLQAAKDLNTTQLWNQMRRDILGLGIWDDPDDPGLDHAGFGHIFRNYDAGFFAYALSKVYAADLYASEFAKNPMDPAVARRYRYTVLQPGSSQSPMKTLEEFLGRKPNTEAYFQTVFGGLKAQS